MELNPQVVFERLFGSGATPEVRAQRMKQSRASSTRSSSELAGLRKQLGAGGRPDGQSVHRRDSRDRAPHPARREGVGDVPELDLPPGIPEQFDEHIKLHSDLLALAFKADITRVATLLGARDLTGRVLPVPEERAFPDGGTSVSFHGGSHHQDDPAQIRRYADAQPLSRLDDGVPRREAEGDAGRRRHAARPLADPLRHQHGQLESAPALRRAAPPGRRRQRQAQGQPSPRLRAQDGDDRQPAAERPGHVRHPARTSRATAPAALPKLV